MGIGASTTLVLGICNLLWADEDCGVRCMVLFAERARQIDLALGALDAAWRGDPSAIDAAFADLVGHEPRLPALRS